MTENDVRQHIVNEIQRSSLRKVAKRVGISPAYLSDIINGKRGISANVAALFGFDWQISVQVTYTKRC